MGVSVGSFWGSLIQTSVRILGGRGLRVKRSGWVLKARFRVAVRASSTWP